MTLLPTSPLRQPRICGAVDLARETGADSVIGVEELPPHFNPMRVVTIDGGGWAGSSSAGSRSSGGQGAGRTCRRRG
jgi:hypothetical protein